MPSEPVLEYEGQTIDKDGIWDLYTESLLEHRDGVEELLEIMVQLGMKDLPTQKTFVAVATEFRLLASVSSGMTVNYAQLFHLAQKWGLDIEWLQKLKRLSGTKDSNTQGT
jgi:hypothetical protein